jgi:hypothetical protein
MVQWDSSRERTFIDVRKGGPGNPWLLFDTQGEITAPSGGGQSVDSRWGRGENGLSEYKGAVITDNPARFEFDLMYRLDPAKLLFLQQIKCAADLRLRQRCGDFKDITAYEAIIGYLDSFPTSRSYSTPLANNAAQPGDDVMDTLSMSAAFEMRQKKLKHLSATKTWVDAVINQIISVGLAQCPGDCGPELNGQEEFWCVTSQDSTPGYISQPAAQFGYTLDSGNTWTFSYIHPLQNADALSLVKVGPRVFVASPAGGIVYARVQDIKDGVSLPWTRALAGGANGPRYITVTPNGTLFAAGLNGYIYRSIDGGFTWTTFDAGVVTTNQLNKIAVASDNLVWFAGNTGTLLRYQGGVVGTVASGITAHINALAVPSGREAEVYFGTAAGRLYRSRNSTATTPTIAELALDLQGTGSIEDIAFAGFRGDVMFLIQSRADGKSRVLRDLSGGAAGSQIEADIGSFDSPTQNGINSIAPANANFAMTAGELVGGYGWLGVVSAD